MVSNKLREVRETSGMSVSELARKVGTSRQNMTKIELHGRIPSGLLMIKICEVLKCEPKEIFF